MPPSIPRIPAILRLGPVPVPHTNEAVYALDANGRRWVAKREADMGCEALLAEALSWRLARAADVPVPDAAFCDHPEERAWLSAWVPHAKHWSATSTGPIDNAVKAAAILALDAVIFNEARHAGNLLVVPIPAGNSTVMAIDADEALIGHPAELAARGLVPPDPRILAQGFPPEGWTALALLAAFRIAALSASELRSMVADTCAIAREPDEQSVLAVLIARCEAAPELTEQYLQAVEARR